MSDYTYQFPNNSIQTSGVGFTLGDISYPANWLDLASNTELTAIGITRIAPTPFSPTANDIVELQSVTVSKAFSYMYNVVLESASVNSVSSYSNASFQYGTDKVTRENIQGTVTAITAGIPFPDPLPWTPKGYIEPVSLSHTDLVMASAAILMKVNEIYGIYFVHKANILMSDDWDYIVAYDYRTNYANT